MMFHVLRPSHPNWVMPKLRLHSGDISRWLRQFEGWFEWRDGQWGTVDEYGDEGWEACEPYEEDPPIV